MALDASLGRANIAIRATLDKLDQDLGQAKQKTNSAIGNIVSGGAKNFQTLGKVAIGAGIGGATAAIAGFGAVVNNTLPLAGDFQSALVTLEIAAKGSGQSLDELHDMALLVGGDTRLLGVSATEAAASMKGLYKAGLTSTEIFGDVNGYMEGTTELGGALRASIDLAAATTLDMVQASDLAAISLASFGGELETEEERAEFVNSALNNLVKAADASVAEVDGLADAMKNVGPVASSMGISIEDTNNTLALLSTRGIQGSEAGTAMRSMLSNLRRPTKSVKEALEELNVSLYDAEGNFIGMPALIGELEGAFADLTQEQKDVYAQTIAGTYGMNALTTLLAEGTDGWSAMADAIETAAGIEEQAAAKTDTFAGKMEALEGNIETLRIKIGETFLPVAEAMIPIFDEIVEDVGPALTSWFSNSLGPALEKAVEFLGAFIEGIMAGYGPIDALRAGLREIGLDQLAAGINRFIERIRALWDTISPVVSVFTDWIRDNVELQDVLIGLGAAIASVVIPAIISIAGPVLATFAAITLAVALVRNAWETDWGGIRTWMTEFWNNTLRPILADLWGWLSVNIPAAIRTVSDFWNNTLQPALQNIWTFLKENIFPVLEALGTVYLAIVQKYFETLGAIIANVIIPHLKELWENFKIIADFIGDVLGPVFEWLKDDILKPFFRWIEKITGGVKGLVSWLNNLAAKIRGIQLPDWATPGSPTPFELGLRGMRKELERLNTMRMPEFFGGSNVAMAMGGGLNGAGAAGAGITIHNHFGADSIRSESDIYALAEQIESSMRLRAGDIIR